MRGKRIVIMIGGKSHNGKGAVADFIIEHSNQNLNKIQSSLSTYIRQIAKDDFFWDGNDTDEFREFAGEVYRLGTKLYPYHMSRRVWERDNLPFIDNSKDNLVVVESLREKQNYDYYKELLGNGNIDELITIRVVRPDFTDLKNKERLQHVSETDLDNFRFDYIIGNDSTLDSLKNKTIDLLRLLELEEYDG